MSTTATYVAVVVYFLVMLALVVFYVQDANRSEALYKRALGRLSAMYAHNAELEKTVEEKTKRVYTLHKDLHVQLQQISDLEQELQNLAPEFAAAHTEPPFGSLVAADDELVWFRTSAKDEPWLYLGVKSEQIFTSWFGLCKAQENLRVLRWGWKS